MTLISIDLKPTPAPANDVTTRELVSPDRTFLENEKPIGARVSRRITIEIQTTTHSPPGDQSGHNIYEWVHRHAFLVTAAVTFLLCCVAVILYAFRHVPWHGE